jgi:hypothetical protein
MMTEFPPPDARLVGKLRIHSIELLTDPVAETGDHSATFRGHAASDEERVSPDDAEIVRLAKRGLLEYGRERKSAAKRLCGVARPRCLT